MTKRVVVLIAALFVAGVAVAGPALACGGLVAPNGTVRLLRTTTLAGWHDGQEHYVTSFQVLGDPQDGSAAPAGSGEFGSIVPLPAVPTSVVRGGDWTLQRLEKETTPQQRVAATEGAATFAAAAAPAEVLQQVHIDALDLTVLKGGGQAVGDWAKQHGFLLTPDAPQMLDYYAKQSPIFLAARFNAGEARQRGQAIGDGTPIHITMPMPHPWVPLRILTLGRQELEPVQADVYLLTDDQPALRPGLGDNTGMTLEYSQSASPQLLSDLRTDKGMDWVPQSAWLSLVRIDGTAQQLNHDLDVRLPATTGSALPAAPINTVTHHSPPAWPWVLTGAVGMGVIALCVGGLLARRLTS